MCGSGTCQVTRFTLVHEDSGVGLVVGTPSAWRSSRFPYSGYLLVSTVDLYIYIYIYIRLTTDGGFVRFHRFPM